MRERLIRERRKSRGRRIKEYTKINKREEESKE